MERYQFTTLTMTDALLVLKGAAVTLGVWGLAMVLGIVIGLGLALIRQGRVPVLATAVVVYVETFRNSPLLVQLFLVFFGLPMVTGIGLDPVVAGVGVLAVNTGAFMTVIVLSGIQAVPRGQWEAARAFGLGYMRTLAEIILPQAMRTMIAPTVTLAVGQLQVSSLVAFIGVTDLTKVGTMLNVRTLEPFLIWPIVGAVYFAVSKPLSLLAEWLEARVQLKSGWVAARESQS